MVGRAFDKDKGNGPERLRPYTETDWWAHQLVRRARFLRGVCQGESMRALYAKRVAVTLANVRRLSLSDYGDLREEAEHHLMEAELLIAGEALTDEEAGPREPVRSVRAAAARIARPMTLLEESGA